jgi:lambda repressor-like predicted transcriptional regulator
MPTDRGNVLRLPNERLRQAMISAGITTKTLARKAGVHPRTVQRWLDYHRPPKDRDLREQVAKLLGVAAAYLWPTPTPRPAVAEELVGYYPAARDIPAEVWNSLLYGSNDVAILTDDPVLIVGEMPAFLPALVMRAAARYRVRLMVHDPDDPAMDKDDPLVRNVRALCAEVQTFADLRLHRHRLGQSIFIFGEDMLVVLHTGADAALDEPALHLRLTDDARHPAVPARVRPDAAGGYATFTRAFKAAWDRPTSPNPLSEHPEISRLAIRKPPPGITEEEHLVRTETFAELTRRFSQIREALLDLDPEPEIRLRLDQILTALGWFDPDSPDVLSPADIADALAAPVRLLHAMPTPTADAVPEPRDPEHPDTDDEQ